MKWLIMHLSLFFIGVIMFASVLVFEIDGMLGFVLATLGVFLIVVGLTLKGLVRVFFNIL